MKAAKKTTTTVEQHKRTIRRSQTGRPPRY